MTIQRLPGVASRMPSVVIYLQTSCVSANLATSAMVRCIARMWTNVRYQVHVVTILCATTYLVITPARVKTDSRETRSTVWVHRRDRGCVVEKTISWRLKWIITCLRQLPYRSNFFSDIYMTMRILILIIIVHLKWWASGGCGLIMMYIYWQIPIWNIYTKL